MRRALLGLAVLVGVAPAASASPVSPTEAVQAAAAAAIAGAWPEADVEVAVVRLSSDAEAATPPLRIRFLDDGQPSGQVSAEVEVQADGDWHRAGWAVLTVTWYRTALVATRDLSTGDVIEPGDVQSTRVETPAYDTLLDPDALGPDWEAARSIRAGDALTTRLVRRPAAAERGDPVRIAYARGALRITLDGEARQRGAVGDTISVYCSTTRTTYRVRLTAPGRGDWTGDR